MRALWAELRRRHVVRMAVAYCALAWLVLQVAALLVPIFDIPNWALKLLVLVVVLGFPFALLFSWHYAWADGGLVRESATAGEPRGSAATAGFDAVQAIAPAPAEASIAVLPLVNMSSDREQDYFSDGLSEELLNLLAQVPGLHVAGRTSSFSFKDKPATIGEIGRALNVATVLEGSVRKSGERVRITAQLVKARDGYHLWSQAYDRELTDIFAVQDEIAAAVVDALKLRLLPAQQPSTAGHHVPGTAASRISCSGGSCSTARRRKDSIAQSANSRRRSRWNPATPPRWPGWRWPRPTPRITPIPMRRCWQAANVRVMPPNVRSPAIPCWARPTPRARCCASCSTSTGTVAMPISRRRWCSIPAT